MQADTPCYFSLDNIYLVQGSPSLPVLTILVHCILVEHLIDCGDGLPIVFLHVYFHSEHSNQILGRYEWFLNSTPNYFNLTWLQISFEQKQICYVRPF